MNARWIQRYSRSQDFLSNCIAQNPSTGLFNKKTGELVAHVMMFETGTAGNLFVEEKYRRKGFGEAVTSVQHLKMRRQLGCDIIGHIAHQNNASFQLFNKIYKGQWIDNNSWIGILPKEPQKVVPLWGHL